MASDEFNSGLSPARTGHPSLLQMLVQPEQVHGPEGSSQPGRELHPLLHFLPRTPVNVAVGQPRSSQSGDIGDKKTQRLGASPTEGQGLLSGLGLEPPSYSGDLFEVSSPSTPHDDREFNDGTACETSPKRVHLSPTRSRSPAKTRSGILPSVTSLLSPSKTHPWWKSLLSSPARRFAADTGRHLPGMCTKPDPFSLLEPQETRPHTPQKGVKQTVWKGAKSSSKEGSQISGRRDLPKRSKPQEGASKPSLRRALEVMKSKKAMKAAMESVENDYFANPSRVAQSAKRHAVNAILGAAYESAMPLTPEKLQALAGALGTNHPTLT